MYTHRELGISHRSQASWLFYTRQKKTTSFPLEKCRYRSPCIRTAVPQYCRQKCYQGTQLLPDNHLHSALDESIDDPRRQTNGLQLVYGIPVGQIFPTSSTRPRHSCWENWDWTGLQILPLA